MSTSNQLVRNPETGTYRFNQVTLYSNRFGWHESLRSPRGGHWTYSVTAYGLCQYKAQPGRPKPRSTSFPLPSYWVICNLPRRPRR